MDLLKHLAPELLITTINDLVQGKNVFSGVFVNDVLIKELLRDIFRHPLDPKSVWIDVAIILLQDKRVTQFERNLAMVAASEWGYVNVAKLLLFNDDVDPGHLNSLMNRASEKGHIDIIKLLFQDNRVEPSNMNNYAIRIASLKHHFDIVKLLLNDERIDLSKCDFLPSNYDSQMCLIKIIFSNKEWSSKFDHETLIIKILSDSDYDRNVAAFIIDQIDVNQLIDKNVIEFANECKRAQSSHMKLINVMKSENVTDIHVKIKSTRIKIVITKLLSNNGDKDILVSYVDQNIMIGPNGENVVNFKSKCCYLPQYHIDMINIMKSGGITNIHIKIKPTETEITEIIHKNDVTKTTIIDK